MGKVTKPTIKLGKLLNHHFWERFDLEFELEFVAFELEFEFECEFELEFFGKQTKPSTLGK